MTNCIGKYHQKVTFHDSVSLCCDLLQNNTTIERACFLFRSSLITNSLVHFAISCFAQINWRFQRYFVAKIHFRFSIKMKRFEIITREIPHYNRAFFWSETVFSLVGIFHDFWSEPDAAFGFVINQNSCCNFFPYRFSLSARNWNLFFCTN